MILLGALAPDTALLQLLEEAFAAERELADQARRAHENEWLFDLGPAFFSTYSQSAIQVANIVQRSATMVATHGEHAALLVAEVQRTMEQQTKLMSSLHVRIVQYCERVAPNLRPLAQRVAEVCEKVVAVWQQMSANAARLASSPLDAAALRALSSHAAHDSWREVVAHVERLQRGRV